MILGTDALLTAFHAGLLKAYVTDDEGVERPMTAKEFEARLGPNSVDVTLSSSFLYPAYSPLVDPCDPNSLAWASGKYNSIIMLPRTISPTTEQQDMLKQAGNPTLLFALGCTRERFEFQTYNSDGVHVCQFYEGRSTMGRIGIASHVTAGFGDVGFQGAFTLELVNLFPLPIVLYAGMRIGQISFETVERSRPYVGAYSGREHYNQPVAPVLGRHRFFLKEEKP